MPITYPPEMLPPPDEDSEPEIIVEGARNLICLGQPPVAGCGAILTNEELHYYGNCCESCTRAWGDAIEAWRKGGENKELDAMFDAKPKRIERDRPDISDTARCGLVSSWSDFEVHPREN